VELVGNFGIGKQNFGTWLPAPGLVLYSYKGLVRFGLKRSETQPVSYEIIWSVLKFALMWNDCLVRPSQD
jgi:hypothetical protein